MAGEPRGRAAGLHPHRVLTLVALVGIALVASTAGFGRANANEPENLSVISRCLAETPDAYFARVRISNAQNSRTEFPIGEDNRFDPGPIDLGQPVVFRHEGHTIAEIWWPKDAGHTAIVWSVGNLEILLDPTLPDQHCRAEILQVNATGHCAVSTKPDGYGSVWEFDPEAGEESAGYQTQAYMRVSNDSSATWLVPLGDHNYFTPGNPVRGQPTVVPPGDHWFVVTFNHIRITNLRWRFLGTWTTLSVGPRGDVPQCLGLDPDLQGDITLTFPDGEPGIAGLQGPPGPTGPVGPAGPSGDAGLSGDVQIVRSSPQRLDPGGETDAHADCPDGWQLVGGGVELTADGDGAALRASYPDGGAWRVRYGPGQGTITVTATCITSS